MNIQIADYIPNSLVNGRGIRDVIFFSGCKHNCKGCHNKAAQNFNFGNKMSVEDIVNKVLNNRQLIDGITISGGDPFYQYDGLLELLKKLKEHKIDVWVYTGFYQLELRDKYGYEIFKYMNVLVDAPFDEDIREYDLENGVDLKYRGSSNQSFITFDEHGIAKMVFDSAIEIRY